jgi:hypothetical protein
MEITNEGINKVLKFKEEIEEVIKVINETDEGKKLKQGDKVTFCLILKIVELENRIGFLEEGLMPTGGNL